MIAWNFFWEYCNTISYTIKLSRLKHEIFRSSHQEVFWKWLLHELWKKILEKYPRRGSFLFHRYFFEGIWSWTNLENFTEQLFSEVLFFFQNTSQWLLLKLWNTYGKEILRTIKTTYFKFIYKEFKSYKKRNIYQKR